MTRVRKSLTIAAFGYIQYALAIVSGVLLVPLTLRSLGARSWGLWLASGEVLNYATMVDLGMLSVLPWLLAGAEGSQDSERASRLISQSLWFATGMGLLYAVVAAASWLWLPSVLLLSPADRALIGPPLALLVLLGIVKYPLSVFRAALVGIQDATFGGVMTIVAAVLSILLTAVMLVGGYGLYALACASAIPPLVVFGLSAFRLLAIRPDLMPRWSRPQLADFKMLLTNGIGVWVGSLGWQLMSASNAIVIAYLGHPEWVPIYSCTAKLSSSAMQLAWVLPDSSQVSLAQIHGEAPPPSRLRGVVLMVIKLHLLLAGGAAVGVLIFNPAFVKAWVGAGMFGGLTLNALLAVGVVFYSMVHGLVTCAAVLGNRPRVGVAVLANGVLQLGLGVFLGHRLGLVGIAWAGIVAGALTSLPAGLMLLKPSTSMSLRALAGDLIGPWFVRIAPIAVVAAIGGGLYDSLGPWLSGVAGVVLGMAYLRAMRPLYDSLPFGPRVGAWLVRLHLLKPVDSQAPALEAF